MKINLTQRERIFIAILYLSILTLIYHLIGGNADAVFGINIKDYSIWFFSAALMIVMGKYIVEPYFTKPSDAIVNAMTVIIALVGLKEKELFLGYTAIFYYALIVLLVSILCITIKDTQKKWLRKVNEALYLFVKDAGSARFLFSVVYISATYSYFADPKKPIVFITVAAFWAILVFSNVVESLIKKISTLLGVFKNKKGERLGVAIGCENPSLYKVEIDFYDKKNNGDAEYGDLVAMETSSNIGSVGMVINKKYLLNKRWLSVYLFRDEEGNPIRINLQSKKRITDDRSIFAQDNGVYLIDADSLGADEKDIIYENILFKNKDNFVGYIAAGSNINLVNFSVIRDIGEEKNVSEGSILKTTIYGDEVLYQVINGNTKEEHLENFDTHGYVIGIARKLGKYNRELKELDVSKWVPDIYSPVFFAYSGTVGSEEIERIAHNSIGRLPETDLEIPIKDYASLITHNTAILGILGIGKSCLTYELITKIVEKTSAKVICIDITNEYTEELARYGCGASSIDESRINTVISSSYVRINKDKHKGGNYEEFKMAIEEELVKFIDATTGSKILIINPENFFVSIQTNDIKPKKIGPGQNDWEDQAPMRDISVAEITRIISEIALDICKKRGRTKEPRCLLVYEEAHSLVPEWSSASNEGEERATSGTAKVILQGRKYGLGCFVITQRTANISKSILNQCNTIFALRVFDDTGKDFLSNYIGKDYADALSTLEERCAITIGKGLRLKQPVIIKLNDQKFFISSDTEQDPLEGEEI